MFVKNPALVDPVVKGAPSTSTASPWRRSRTASSARSRPTSPGPATWRGSRRSATSSPTPNWHTRSPRSGAQIALMNPGGIRSSFTYANSPGGEPLRTGDVRRGVRRAAVRQPGRHADPDGGPDKDVLEQQRLSGSEDVGRVMQPSAGFTYSYDSDLAAGAGSSEMALNGAADRPRGDVPGHVERLPRQRRGRVPPLPAGTNRVYAPGFDVDALVAFLGAGRSRRDREPDHSGALTHRPVTDYFTVATCHGADRRGHPVARQPPRPSPSAPRWPRRARTTRTSCQRGRSGRCVRRSTETSPR